MHLRYAESLEDPAQSITFTTLQNAAKENNVSLIGGTLPEKEGDKVYNTCLVFNNEGKLLGKYRKMHLFDVDIPGKITYKESEIFTPGDKLGLFELEGLVFGLGICYDLRFPELALVMRQSGADVLVYPSQFSKVTGEMHWELLLRGRAIDTQVKIQSLIVVSNTIDLQTFVVGCSPARLPEDGAPFLCWSHSTIVNPMGKVIATADHLPTIVYGEIDPEQIKAARTAIPTSFQKRKDIYEVKNNSATEVQKRAD